jgi:beta-lactamase superfamily II metal-dependent hydrolase
MRTPPTAFVAAVTVGAVVIAGPFATVRSQSLKPLEVYWIDVEGGAATLLVTPAGQSVLVDAGNPGARDSGRIVKVAKESAHLERIDAVVVTHLHNDHFGGVAELSKLMPIGMLYENGIESAPASEQSQTTVPAYRAASVGRRLVVRPGDKISLRQAPGAAPVTLRVLAARQQFGTPAAGGTPRPNQSNCQNLTQQPVDTSDNANSIVMLLEDGPFRMFLGGDLTWNLEQRLVCPNDGVGPVDVYQSVHHGLDQSNNPALVRTLQPHVVVFNNGVRKGFEKNAVATVTGTPSVEAVYQVHRSLREGAVNTADDRIANRDETCNGDGIAMTVTPDGRSYTMTVPSTGHRKTYQTRAK